MIIPSRLFFGFLAEGVFAAKLSLVADDLKSFIIQNQDPYLYRISHEGKVYLGKYVESELTITDLQLVESNIFSLLRKLLPDYPYRDVELFLIPIIG